ncbi:MAG TPA: carboxypeptidase-like regulatory domain-containing protein [Acidobacteriaceae bacterium]|nr:carboxypeptidase-like regulatory domain-containing protein [Acidobacteriaceae bacterium]
MNRAGQVRRTAARVGVMVALILATACAFAQGPMAMISPGGLMPNVGRVSGIIEDEQGALIPGAKVVLVAEGESLKLTSGSDGRFCFDGVPAGSFTVRASEDGMLDGVKEGTLEAAQQMELEPMMLRAGAVMSVTAVTQEQMATIQVRQEETQRIGGILPNYYVVYDANPQAMTKKLKFEMGWRSVFDPANVLFVGVVAAGQQAENAFPGYGQGMSGYGKRFGAGMADATVGTLLEGSLLPMVFRQDPRYFYKGTGSRVSRTWYALKTTVICKGDNGRWQPAYANVLGSFGSGAVSGLYYPGGEKGGMLVVENGLSALAFDGFANVMQEFVLRRMTPSRREE